MSGDCVGQMLNTNPTRRATEMYWVCNMGKDFESKGQDDCNVEIRIFSDE